jgi:hypothetical protein
MIQKKKYLIAMGYGSEIRQFIHSGFASELCRSGTVEIITRFPDKELLKLCARNKIKIHIMPRALSIIFTIKLSIVRNLSAISFSAGKIHQYR